ncbi:MAG: ribosome-binding factor A [Bacteroidetes bacterium RIFCSPLOWO2_02_FULL_36_8]|nr:MAG: ribosome-binding factor A [Bacteroidetes bacterium RIFCSPLOWO2_02_FULL_36_8]OFY69423.1 MAG: ribosome-binding factor A [Bacteroidetes bacterium RIFCSPLOWO2_12_FULL_37_12]
MNTKRQSKVARLIQKELADIFQRKGRNLFGNSLITITEVSVSPDLGMAKVYLSILGSEKHAIFSQVKSRTYDLKKDLIPRIKNLFHHIPEIVFYLDETLDHAERIERLLKESASNGL